MTLLDVVLRLVICAGLGLVGLLVGVLLVLAGLPEWLLWAMPVWFGVVMPALGLLIGAAAGDLPRSRPGRRPDHPQRPIAPHPRGREPKLEDLYP